MLTFAVNLDTRHEKLDLKLVINLLYFFDFKIPSF